MLLVAFALTMLGVMMLLVGSMGAFLSATEHSRRRFHRVAFSGFLQLLAAVGSVSLHLLLR